MKPPSPSRPSRLAVVLSHPTQYYSPWFRHLATADGLPGWELRVFYLWDFGVTATHDRQFNRRFQWDVDLLTGYAFEFVPNVAADPGTHHFNGLDNPALRARLVAYAPDAILLFGYAYRSQLGLALRPPAPLIFRGDSHLLGHRPPSLAKRTLLRLLFSRFTAITHVGQANRAYFRRFGVPDARLHFVPHCVDDAHFRLTPAVADRAQQQRLALGLTGKFVFLFAGKLVPDKDPAGLLDAFIAAKVPDSVLVLVGEGSERPALEARAAGHRDRVHFLPFTNQSEMPSVLALADVVALPSRGIYETWGLVVNEAMHLGIPCLVSDRVGCQRDLVTEGETGWVFPAGDPAALAAALLRAAAALRADRTGWRNRVAARIAGYTFARAAAGLREVLTAIAS